MPEGDGGKESNHVSFLFSPFSVMEFLVGEIL